jgi:hypothetical protein
VRAKLVFIFFSLSFSLSAHAGEQRYLFFLHNMFLETAALNEAHPEYGRSEYNEIIAAFEKEGFTVISEIRKKGTNGDVYANKVKGQIDSLLRTGALPSAITVLGTSEGAYIAWQVSSLMKNKDMNFILLGMCSPQLIAQHPNSDLCGNILSIYERSDNLGGSCKLLRKRSKCTIPHYKEIELSTGLKHGFLYKALDAWIVPSVRWAKSEYK